MPAPLGLHDSFTEEGFWWIEGKEDEKVGGTLTFDPENGTELKLLGMLRDLTTSIRIFSNENRSNEIIHGVTKEGKLATLLHSINKSQQLNMPGIANETWSSNLLVIGLHIASDDEEIFSKSYIRFEGIERWLGQRPFTVTHDDAESIVTVKAKKSRETKFASHKEFEITSVDSLYADNKIKTRYVVDVISQLGIAPSSLKSLKWHFSKAAGLQELASLCTGRFLPLTSLELRGPDESLGDGRVRPSEVHVYARMRHPEGERHPKREAPVLSGPELVAFNSEAVQRWFDQYEVFNPTIGLFFTITAQHQMFSNVRFLLAIQALEVFHRRTSTDSVVSPEDFPAFADALIAAIPASASDRMKEKLQSTYRYINEPSLGQRLRSIIADLSAEFGFSPPAYNKAYLRKLVDTRNYYTHFSQDLEDKKFDGRGMYWATRRIVLLLSLLFLLRIGVAANDIGRLLTRHDEFAKLWDTDSDPS